MPSSLAHQLEAYQTLMSWYRRSAAEMLKRREITQREFDDNVRRHLEVNATLQFMVRNEDAIREAVRKKPA